MTKVIYCSDIYTSHLFTKFKYLLVREVQLKYIFVLLLRKLMSLNGKHSDINWCRIIPMCEKNSSVGENISSILILSQKQYNVEINFENYSVLSKTCMYIVMCNALDIFSKSVGYSKQSKTIKNDLELTFDI